MCEMPFRHDHNATREGECPTAEPEDEFALDRTKVTQVGRGKAVTVRRCAMRIVTIPGRHFRRAHGERSHAARLRKVRAHDPDSPSPYRHRRRRLRRTLRRSGARRCAGRCDRDRQAQPSPVPAAALPGGDRGAVTRGHRRSDPRDPCRPEERARAARPGDRDRPGSAPGHADGRQTAFLRLADPRHGCAPFVLRQGPLGRPRPRDQDH